MKTLSAALTTALGAPVQQPGIFVQAAFSTVQRWSSRSTTTWNSQTWNAMPGMSVDSLQVDFLRVEGSLVFTNLDDVLGALLGNEGASDRAITIWGYDAAATATADVVWLCDAIGSSCQWDERSARIQLKHRTEGVPGLRVRAVPGTNGITTMLPAGAVVRINGIDYELGRQ